jgi:hypothetical protein
MCTSILRGDAGAVDDELAQILGNAGIEVVWIMRNVASVNQLLHESSVPRGARMVRVLSMRVGAFMPENSKRAGRRL